MAIIAIFCDGTWNDFENPYRTHVARLSEACARTDDQKVLYIPGVGTGGGMMSRIDRLFDKIGGGLFGWGINRKIIEAYKEICTHYEAGDKIMVFGFSRGAYTARSLVGMIRKCGILPDPSPKNLRQALRFYRTRGPDYKPDKPHVWEKRRAFSPHFATSQYDVMARNDDSALVRVTYIGVWDTVGALGIPRSVLGPIASLWNTRYAFHDTSLSGMVEQARHAVAIDEKRVLFEPSLWDNFEATKDDPGLNKGDESDTRRYQQKWFVGSHGVVGGSVAPKGVSVASLQWIWQGAEAQGLKVVEGTKIFDSDIDMAADAPELYKVNLLYKVARWLVKWRDGPQVLKNLHETAQHRTTLIENYRPLSLRRVLPRLF